MYQKYFPTCPVAGAIDPPIPFSHMFLRGAIPHKCGVCENLFEGECKRSLSDVGGYLYLDHGYCGINGPTDPITYQDQYIFSKVEIPRKCSTCQFLTFDRIGGFQCLKDANKWGDFHRGLDWGTWELDSVYLQLPLPKITTKQLSLLAKQNEVTAFIIEY